MYVKKYQVWGRPSQVVPDCIHFFTGQTMNCKNIKGPGQVKIAFILAMSGLKFSTQGKILVPGAIQYSMYTALNWCMFLKYWIGLCDSHVWSIYACDLGIQILHKYHDICTKSGLLHRFNFGLPWICLFILEIIKISSWQVKSSLTMNL